MPSARKLSWEEQAKNLELRATECKQKAQRKFIDCVLDKNPHVLNEIVAKIHALGFSEESAAQTPNAKSLQRAATDNRKSSKTKPAIADRDEDPAVVLTPYHRLDACSVAFLIDNVLAHCEPGAMSQPNLKRLMARGRAAQNREVLLELVQFSTGLLPDTALSGKLATLQSFKHFCVERHLARGRRTRDLQLPPTWQTDGVYRIGKISEEFIEVKHGFSEFAILISRRNAPAVEKESDYTLLYNFSELRAALANSHDQEKVVLLYPLFPNAGPTPASTLALQDDQTALPPKKKSAWRSAMVRRQAQLALALVALTQQTMLLVSLTPRWVVHRSRRTKNAKPLRWATARRLWRPLIFRCPPPRARPSRTLLESGELGLAGARPHGRDEGLCGLIRAGFARATLNARGRPTMLQLSLVVLTPRPLAVVLFGFSRSAAACIGDGSLNVVSAPLRLREKVESKSIAQQAIRKTVDASTRCLSSLL